jgi:tetratricopeptide (TPR) repeat protein
MMGSRQEAHTLMYLGRPKRHTQSLVRIIILVGLIGAGAYILSHTGETTPPPTPTPAPTRTASSYITEAEAAVQAGKLDDAILAYKVALTLEPDNPDITPPLVRLIIYQSQGRKDRLQEGLRLAQRATRVMTDSAPIQASLSLALGWNDQTLDAINAGKLATQLDPNYAEGFAYLAEAYADGKNWPRAQDAADTAVRLNPNSVDAYRAKGYVLEMQGRFGEAIVAYQPMLTLAPKVAFLYITIARNYRYASNFDGAIKMAERALELEPDRADAQDELGWSYYESYAAYGRTADLEHAIEELDQATKGNPDYATAWAHLGIAYYRRRNYEDAILALQKGLDLGANRIEYYYTLGLAHYYMAECDQAMPLFQKALSIDPNDLPAQGGVNLCLGVTATPLAPTRKP